MTHKLKVGLFVLMLLSTTIVGGVSAQDGSQQDAQERTADDILDEYSQSDFIELVQQGYSEDTTEAEYRAVVRFYPSEAMNLSESETEAFESFISTASENFEQSPEQIREANQEQSETDSESDSQQDVEDLPDEREILTILEVQDRNQISEVERWLDSERAEQYPELADRARDWVNQVEQEEQEAREELDGFQEISSEVRVVGYEFNSEEESATILIESDTRRTVTIQDVGGTIAEDSDGFSYRLERVDSGITQLQVEAQVAELRGEDVQMVAITDPQNQTGNTLSKRVDAPSQFLTQQIMVRYSLAGLIGFTLFAGMYLVHRFYKRNNKGNVVTADGYELSEGKVHGDKMEPNDTEIDYNNGD